LRYLMGNEKFKTASDSLAAPQDAGST
jgi:hypothetical protein